LAESEQQNTALALGVCEDAAEGVAAAAGFLVHALPGASEEETRRAEHNVRANAHPSELVAQGCDAHELARRLLDGLGEREAVASVVMRNDLSLGAVFRVAAALRAHAPALVHCHSGRANWVGGIAALWVGVPALSTRRMDRTVARGLRTRWLYRRLLHRVAAI